MSDPSTFSVPGPETVGHRRAIALLITGAYFLVGTEPTADAAGLKTTDGGAARWWRPGCDPAYKVLTRATANVDPGGVGSTP